MPSGIYKRTKKHGEKISMGQITGRKVGRHKRELGERNPSWKGGKVKILGYLYLYSPEHPHRICKNYVSEHRLVMEKHIGRFVDPKTEIIHHINGNKLDNRIENLELTNRSDHVRKHPEIINRLRNAIKKGQRISIATEFKKGHNSHTV